MTLKNALFSLTAAAILVTPVAARAGTTASAWTGIIANLSGGGEHKSTAVKQKLDIGQTLIVAGYGIYELLNNERNASHGF